MCAESHALGMILFNDVCVISQQHIWKWLLCNIITVQLRTVMSYIPLQWLQQINVLNEVQFGVLSSRLNLRAFSGQTPLIFKKVEHKSFDVVSNSSQIEPTPTIIYIFRKFQGDVMPHIHIICLYIMSVPPCALQAVTQRRQQVLDDMKQIASSDNNFKNYRDRLRNINPPCVPFVGELISTAVFQRMYTKQILSDSACLTLCA